MQPESLREAEDWLGRADRDVLAAEQLLQAPVPLLDIAVYHAQQAAEKSLKGYLVAHGQNLPKVHDLVPLVVRCQNIDRGFSQFLDAARILTPYEVRFRYPGGPIEPSVVEAKDALRLARDMVRFVRQQLPAAGPR